MELIFRLGNEYVIVKIKDGNLLFSTSYLNYSKFIPIDGLMLKREGIIKEHPDLKGLPDEDMRMEAIKRLKEKVKSFKTENEIKDYVIGELEPYGYSCEKIKREGFRPIRLK